MTAPAAPDPGPAGDAPSVDAPPADAPPADAHLALARFEAERRRLFAIAYRMLGSALDAEDVLQDAYLRWQAVPQREVGHPGAYLVRLVTRLCLDALRSAHARRVEYVGPWLPEPLIVENDLVSEPTGPELQELAEELSLAFLVLLERLAPVERAVFLLRESFGFDYREIARVVGKSAEHCRQIDRRARQRLADGGRARPVDRAAHRALVERFLHATRDGDVDGLLALLADDAVTYADGGGKVTSARRPIVGATRVARFLAGVVGKAPPGTEIRLGRVNGEPGLLTYVGGRLYNVAALYAEAGRISRIFIVANPDKLRATS